MSSSSTQFPHREGAETEATVTVQVKESVADNWGLFWESREAFPVGGIAPGQSMMEPTAQEQLLQAEVAEGDRQHSN